MIRFLIFIFLFLTTSVLAGQFGQNGRDGRDGYDGQNGRHGEDREIIAKGDMYNYNLSGADAGDGGDGDYGEDAWNCYQRMQNEDEYGAFGGNAGRAGNGGIGGNAGDITIYYQDESNLKNITINSTPGRGGAAGRTGYAGRGCKCQAYRWERNGNTYRCFDGRDGRDGERGLDGRSGDGSTISLIQRLEPLEPENNTRSLRIQDVPANNPLYINDHLWSFGASYAGLFSNNSRIENASYFKYTKTDERTVFVSWDAEQSMARYSTSQITFTLKNGSFRIDPIEPFWPIYKHERGPIESHISITDAALSTDARQIEINQLLGLEKEITLHLEDKANMLDKIPATFEIDYQTRFGGVFYQSRYQGSVSDQYLHRNGNQLVFDIGKMPIENQYKRWGTFVKIIVHATRRFGPYQLVDTFEIKKRLF